MSELDPETHQLHDKTMAEEATLQEAVNSVAAMDLGHDVAAIADELRRAIARYGHPQPTRDWVDAVAVDLSYGNRYVVGTRSEQDAQARRRGEGR